MADAQNNQKNQQQDLNQILKVRREKHTFQIDFVFIKLSQSFFLFIRATKIQIIILIM